GGVISGSVVDDDHLPHELASLRRGNVVGDGLTFVSRGDDRVDRHPLDRDIPFRSPFFTNLTATLRVASSIISSPNMTAPLRSPSVVAFAYASRTSHALSNCSWLGENTSLRIVT